MLRILSVGFPRFACHDNYVFAFRCLGIDISSHVFVGKLPKIIEGAFGMHPLAERLFDSNHFHKAWFKAWLLVLCHSDHKCLAEKSFKKGELPKKENYHQQRVQILFATSNSDKRIIKPPKLRPR